MSAACDPTSRWKRPPTAGKTTSVGRFSKASTMTVATSSAETDLSAKVMTADGSASSCSSIGVRVPGGWTMVKSTRPPRSSIASAWCQARSACLLAPYIA